MSDCILESNPERHAVAGSAESRLLEVVMPEKGYALMFEAYFDESGTHHASPIMCVAGYLIEADQCRRFQADWDAILARHHVPYFHMSDCAHGTGVFSNTPKDVRSEICRSLIELIKLRTEIGIAVSLSESMFKCLAPNDYRIDAYTFCLQHCMRGVTAWATRYNVYDPVSYFFESGHRHESVANDLINWFRRSQSIVDGFRYYSHSFVSGKRLCGISAADLLAWEWIAAYRNKYGPVRRRPRMSLQNLLRKGHMMVHFNEDDLRAYFKAGQARARGEDPVLPPKFTQFLSTLDFPEKPIGEL